MAFKFNSSSVMLWTCAIVLIGLQPEVNDAANGWKVPSTLENWKYKGKCLHVKNPKGQLDLETCDNSDETQHLNAEDWKYYISTPGVIKFDSNGLCAAPEKGATTKGTPVVLVTCGAGPPDIQSWRIGSGDYSGIFQLKNKKTGLCLSAENNGGQIVQVYCEPARYLAMEQYWRIRPQPARASSP